MPEAIEFPGQTVIIAKNQPEYTPIPARMEGGQEGRATFCWKFSDKELQEIVRTGVLWHTVLTFGGALQPQLLQVNAPDFAEELVSDEVLHRREAHPDYEYATTEGPRKSWYDEDVPPEADAGWEKNVDRGRNGWERFDYTEEAYWRRLKVRCQPDSQSQSEQ